MGFAEQLSGGPRRELIGVESVFASVLSDSNRINELAECVSSCDPVVVIRALNCLEKLSHEKPELLQSIRAIFLKDWSDFPFWEARLSVTRSIKLINWTETELDLALDQLRKMTQNHKEKFVWAWSIDSFASLASGNQDLESEAWNLIDEGISSGVKSVVARLKQTAQQLGRSDKH